jgi:hypothetical protein
MVMTRSRGDTTDGVVAYAVFVGGSMLVALVAGVFVGLPWQVTLLVVAAAAVTGVVIAAMASSDRRRDTQRWQDAAVAVSAWASRNACRCETSPQAFDSDGRTGEWTLPASPRFSGTILAVAHRHGFEVGVACYEQPDGEGATSRHTALLVRLAATHQRVRLTSRSWRRRSGAGMTEVANRMVAALPARPESVEIQDRELCVVYYGWPGSMDLDARVDASVEVARALREEKV